MWKPAPESCSTALRKDASSGTAWTASRFGLQSGNEECTLDPQPDLVNGYDEGELIHDDYGDMVCETCETARSTETLAFRLLLIQSLQTRQCVIFSNKFATQLTVALVSVLLARLHLLKIHQKLRLWEKALLHLREKALIRLRETVLLRPAE